MDKCLSYDEAVVLLSESLKFGIDPSLEPIRAMCSGLGDPQKAYECIQVAGTNGKSSTTRMIAALLHSQGLKVGLYTSPHLVKYPERIEIDGKVVDDELFAAGVSAAVCAAQKVHAQATEFELLTAAALWVFCHEQVEWAVLECGLGGRWDATSVVTPRIAVITGVALEHTNVLGDTIEKIAAEKAAIIKPGCTAIFAHDLAARDVFESRAHEVGASFSYTNPISTAVIEDSLVHLPEYQHGNAATSLSAVHAAMGGDINLEDARAALSGLVIPGRFETIREHPLCIVDAAHNPQSARVLAHEISRRYIVANRQSVSAHDQRQEGKPEVPTLLLGVLADKDVRGIVCALCPLFTRIVVTASSSPRSVQADDLARIVEDETGMLPEVAPTIADARELLRDEAVIATGSITVAGEVIDIW